MESKSHFFQEIGELNEYLNTLWTEIGLSDDEKRRKKRAIIGSLLNHMKKAKEEETKVKDKLIKNIDETGLKLHHLATALNIPDVTEPEPNMSLLKLDKYLKDQLLIYEEKANSKIEKLQKLRLQESDLCKRIGEEPAYIPPSRVPSEETLNHLTRVINTLEVETENRIRMFRSLKASIWAHMEELEMKPTTTFDRNILTSAEDLIILSEDTMQQMKMKSQALQNKIVELREREQKLKDDIYLLWDRLAVDEERRQHFHKELSYGSTVRNIPKLEGELKEMELQKHQNMGRFINQMRRELEEWWEKCYVSEDEKENFKPYFSEHYSQTVLEEHENEVQKYKEFYNNNEAIFQNLENWQMLWNKVRELEDKANDPARLFGNRGCALLQEEKERKRVSKELPRLERELDHLLKVWERENGRQFLILGRTLVNFQKSQWEEYNERKNREKQIRHTARTKQLQQDAQLGTSSVKTPQRKRNLVQSETLRTSKYLRVNDGERAPSVSPVSGRGSTLSRASFRNLASSPKVFTGTRLTKAPVRRARRQPATHGAHQNTFSSSDVSSYDRFSEEIHRLSERENVRSSVMPRKYLGCNSPRNTTARGLKGLPRTPLNSSKVTKMSSPLSAKRRQPLTPNANFQNTAQRPSNYRVPSTLPRRRSARLINSSKCLFTNSRSTLSPSVRSQKSSGYGSTRLTTPIRNRLNFLM